MGSIILALPKQEDAQKISTGLGGNGLEVDAVCTSAAEVLQEANRRDNGVVICTSRLRDMNYRELAQYLPDYFEILLLSSAPALDDSPPEIVHVSIPFRLLDLVATVEMMLTQQERRMKKNRAPIGQRKDEEKAQINHAKQILMERNQMTEPEAYRYIQKCSMDSGTNMVETAQMILLLSNEH